MSQDIIRIRDLVDQLPALVRRLPKIIRGYYYYAQKKDTKPLTIGGLIERNAERYGDRPAVLYEDRSVSYAELNEWANRYSHFFQQQGLKKGDRIAIFLENRPELLAVFIGAAKLGVACALINTAQKGQVLEHSIKLTEPRMVVVGEELTEAFDGIKDRLSCDHANPFLFLADRDTRTDLGQAPDGYLNVAQEIIRCAVSNPAVDNPPRMGDTAFYLFTSGTTGLPKAAPGSHRKFVKAYGGFGLMSLGMTPEDVIYVTLPFYHGTAILVCWGAAVAGGSAIVMRRKFSARKFWDDVRYYRATTFGYVGELCRYLLNQPPSSEDRNHPLRKMIGNGLRPSIWRTFKDRFGIEKVAEFYASSEGNIGFSNFLNLDNTVGMSTAPYALVKFHEGTRDPVRNEKGLLEEVAQGEPGLLLGEITKKWSFEGYTQKEATEKSIIHGAFKKNDAWFNTGDVLKDLGWRHLQFVDRMGDTFRWKGENVSTNEVENIIDGFGGLDEVVVYGVEVPHTNGKAGMATVVPSEDHLDLDAFYAYLQENLPPYAVPVFVRVTDAIAKTGTFKYKKKDIQDLGYQQGPQNDRVYVAIPGKTGYSLLDSATVEAIDKGEIRL
ncbi:long-chain-acyl-CoA synthetase [Hydrocarboniclastica marina]|uniref:Long-chain-acyl-CoA synthetase n=1 Tax=Hydrocarboniclastica marina TaxID=2259620 RepID=A0A4P7XJU1_9ALTE|nr:long-chain-acyl-CoA synthetase [Hydrocarboniclastica marina]MAL97556.1 long-chain-acyl-CoA synthetase [Alteromonadaceae bacterium]QCF26652.1 long-chain-acyl-CoA synthetase [Hydrocarboniclastica marina]